MDFKPSRNETRAPEINRVLNWSSCMGRKLELAHKPHVELEACEMLLHKGWSMGRSMKD